MRHPITFDMKNGAANYALADKSDPFAYNRAMSHNLNGVCNHEFHYSAEPFYEERVTSQGEKYQVVSYKNMVRP